MDAYWGERGADNRESYRDLLRTAERIMDMDTAAQKVERNLSETSRNCNSRLLERKARNLKIFEERVGAAGMLCVGRARFCSAGN